MVTKKYESYKEQRQRMNYATELIEERDYNFEKRLVEIDRVIRGSEELKGWIEVGEEQEAEALLSGELLDLRGYNYSCEITFCRAGDSLWLTDTREQWGCREYFEWIIRKNGHRIDDLRFLFHRCFRWICHLYRAISFRGSKSLSSFRCSQGRRRHRVSANPVP